jgi:phage shock protein A
MEREQIEKQYLLSLLTQKKQAERKMTELEDEMALWRKRLELAREHGREDLITAAEARLAELELSLPEFKGRIALLDRDISVARGEVTDAKIDGDRAMSRARTDALVQQLQTASGTGEPDPLDFNAVKREEERSVKKEIDKLEGDMALEELRKRLKDEE